MELVIARNPDPDSRLPYLIRLPLAEPLVFATKDVWPRTSGLYCHPLPLEAWPQDADEVERVRLKVCTRRGAAIDIIADRTRESRTQIVYTQARGRQMIFWQSPRTRKQSRPDVRIPTARAVGVRELEVLVDAHEKYPYKFPQAAVATTRKALPCGDYAVTNNGRPVAAVERKGLEDLVGSLTGGRLRYALGELAALPRAAVVVEAPYSKIFAQKWVRPALVADGLAELQVAWPSVPIVFCETRKLAEEWTYRWLSAALVWVEQEAAIAGPQEVVVKQEEEPSTRELRAWARAQGMDVPDRGRLRPGVMQAWRDARGL
jgi:hypothetical protein